MELLRTHFIIQLIFILSINEIKCKELEEKQIQHCGKNLYDALMLICKGKLYTTTIGQTYNSISRERRGLVDECCKQPCRMSVMKLYCAPPSKITSIPTSLTSTFESEITVTAEQTTFSTNIQTSSESSLATFPSTEDITRSITTVSRSTPVTEVLATKKPSGTSHKPKPDYASEVLNWLAAQMTELGTSPKPKSFTPSRTFRLLGSHVKN
ncbi:hypothetical protein QAD02_008653 [Eretmocerus hayati]|uniref:Uncharacterized protein n=1 Tax=Eretmocerus hayati TaxID=131215 RepID=A0ACC2N7W4_9HYME|nr:hypothetical protein QAD02_008653 [Eretmocerus hayati]